MKRLKAYLGLIILGLSRGFVAANGGVLGLRKIDWAKADRVRHVVIYRVGNIGDTVVALPALFYLRQRFPQARLTLITSAGPAHLPGAPEVLAPFQGLVDQVISYQPAELKSRRGLQSMKLKVFQSGGPVDLFVDLPVTMQNIRRAMQEQLLAFTLKAKYVLGFDLLLPLWFRHAYARCFPRRIPRTSDWLLSLVNPTRQPVQARPAHLSAMRWAEWDLNPNEPILVVNAGSKLPIKRWSPDAYADLVAELMRSNPFLQVAFIGSEEEDPLNQRIIEAIMSKYPMVSVGITNLSGKLSLLDTWTLVNQARAVLTNDTGTMHIAGMLNKRIVTPMSGQYPAPLWHPPGRPDDFTPARHDVPCAPCFLDSCPLPDQLCMTRIAPIDLRQPLEALLYPPGQEHPSPSPTTEAQG